MTRAEYPHWKVPLVDWSIIDQMDTAISYEICLNQQQVAIVLANLETAAWKTRYLNLTLTDDELLTFIVELRSKFMGVEDCMGCNDCSTQIINNINTYVDNSQTSNDWYGDFISSGGSSVGSQVSDDLKHGQGHDSETSRLWCVMVEQFLPAFRDALLTQYENLQDEKTVRVEKILAGLAAALGAAAILVPPAAAAGLAAAALGAAITAVVVEVSSYYLTPDVIEALQDDDALDQMICCMFARIDSATAVLNWANWQTMFSDQATLCDYDDLSGNALILADVFHELIAHDPRMYVSFFRTLNDFDWLDQVDGLPPCQCPLCGDLTVYNEDTNVWFYHSANWSPAYDEELEASGVQFGAWYSKKTTLDFGESICISDMTLYMRQLSQPYKYFMRFDDGLIVQWNDNRGTGAFRDNVVPLPYSPVTRYITVWARERPGETDDPDQSPLLSPDGDWMYARMSELNYWSET